MGFISDLLSAKNQYQAQNVNLQNADYMKQIQQMLGNAGNTQQANQTAQGQTQLAQMLQQQAQGGGPNLAGAQLQAATDRTSQLAAGAVASQRGLNPALAARQILQNQAAVNQQSANQSAQTTMQQQLNSQGLLGNVLGQQRQQDIGQFQANNGLLGELGQLQQGQNQLAVQQNLGVQGINSGVAAGNQSAQNGLTGSLINAAGGAAQQAFKAADGGEVPDKDEPLVEGDHEANDIVPALLSPGEVVLPRSIVDVDNIDPKKIVEFVMKSKRMASGGEVEKGPQLDADKVRAFVSAFSGEKPKESEPQGYARVLQSRQKLDKIRGEKM